ncbi:MAG TPA: hypothetical protein VMG10_15460 [Gemmataceae bacterium]|nr:hypothetical protein [Gemmataceae bacterium]
MAVTYSGRPDEANGFVAPTLFPGKPNANAVLIHRITAHSKAALWDSVQAWFDGGSAASGEVDPKAADIHNFDSKGGATCPL